MFMYKHPKVEGYVRKQFSMGKEVDCQRGLLKNMTHENMCNDHCACLLEEMLHASPAQAAGHASCAPGTTKRPEWLEWSCREKRWEMGVGEPTR